MINFNYDLKKNPNKPENLSQNCTTIQNWSGCTYFFLSYRVAEHLLENKSLFLLHITQLSFVS